MTILDVTESLRLALVAGNHDEARKLARDVLRRIGPRRSGPVIEAGVLMRAICEQFGLTPQQLRGPRRYRAIAYPRTIGMYLARELTELSFPRIGAFFGGRDHTTVMSACQSVECRIDLDPLLAEDVALLRARLTGSAKEAA